MCLVREAVFEFPCEARALVARSVRRPGLPFVSRPRWAAAGGARRRLRFSTMASSQGGPRARRSPAAGAGEPGPCARPLGAAPGPRQPACASLNRHRGCWRAPLVLKQRGNAAVLACKSRESKGLAWPILLRWLYKG